MNPREKRAGIFSVLILSMFALAPLPVSGKILYKSYIIRQDRGVDILCDPYVVKRNDYLFKLFRQRGEIAEKDFPEFIEIFKRLNPQVPDVNQIVPGQHVYIPLKQLKRDTLLDQDSGVVTIPFVTISTLEEFIQSHTVEHTVQRGEFVSRLIAQRFGDYGTPAYEQAIQLFERLNPKLSDPNRIFPGQAILLPDPSIRKQPWYASLFDAGGRLREEIPPSTTETPPPLPKPTLEPEPVEKAPEPYARLADILEGKLVEKGVYHFPRKDTEDLRLDLSRTPIVELKGGIRLLLLRESLRKQDIDLIESYWKKDRLIPVAADGSLEEIFDAVLGKVEKDRRSQVSFSDQGVEVNVQARWIIARPTEDNRGTRYICINLIGDSSERTPPSVSGYLEKKGVIVEDILQGDAPGTHASKGFPEESIAEELIPIHPSSPRSFVKHMLLALGCRYAENVKITFPYVGIQVEATANMVSTHGGKTVFIDFEDLYGDAVRAIERTGLTVVQITRRDSLRQILEKLLSAMEESYILDPTFYATQRPAAFNTALTVPGFLLEREGYPNKTLIAAVPLHEGVVAFLKKQGVNIIWISGANPGKIG